MTSFFKVLFSDDFNLQIRIPPLFVQDHAASLRSKAILRIASGESWIVKIEKIGRHHFFTEGWNEFSEAVNLEFTDFLLFLFDGESGFTVSVYGASGCEKELSVGSSSGGGQNVEISRGNDESRHKSSLKEETEDEEDVTEQKPDSDAGNTLRFLVTLTKQNEYQLEIPEQFVWQSGMEKTRKMKLRVYSRKKRWAICLTSRKNGSFAITSGWNQFLIGRKVQIGSRISIESVSGRSDVVLLKILEHGNKGLFSARRGRGRPPNFAKSDS